MKILLVMLSFFFIWDYASAQAYSNWIPDSTISTLKLRHAVGKDASGNDVLFLQVASGVPCQLYVTASTCDKDPIDKNGWRYLKFTRRSTLELTFKIGNACNNGFWWKRRDYQ